MRALIALMHHRTNPKARVTLAYRMWAVTDNDCRLSLLDPPAYSWAAGIVGFIQAILYVEKKPARTGGLCQCCKRASQHTQYALAMYARARFGQRAPIYSVMA